MIPRIHRRLTVWLLLIAMLMTLPACYDMGTGEDEKAFYDYFSGVFLISSAGRKLCFIHQFNASMTLEDSEKIKEVVGAGEYAYIAFMVAPGYTLVVDEFAFFFKADDKDGVDSTERRMVLDFYIADELPTKVKGENGYIYLPDSPTGDQGSEEGDYELYIPETDTNGSAVDRRDEVGENMFNDPGYATGSVLTSQTWRSTLLEFDIPQTVREGQFIIVRVKNNCVSENGPVDPTLERVRFTFNHLMFRFTSVQKD